MRVLGIILIVLGAGAAVPATITWLGDRSDAAETEQALLQLEQENDATRKELQETNLLYRGYQQSVPQIPDSIRAAESAIISVPVQGLQQEDHRPGDENPGTGAEDEEGEEQARPTGPRRRSRPCFRLPRGRWCCCSPGR